MKKILSCSHGKTEKVPLTFERGNISFSTTNFIEQSLVSQGKIVG